MTDWQPATEAEAALRDALRTGDQELYFRILSHVDLLLPVAADALAGRSAMGWGTWTSGGRTHILAFTSPQAMNACLADQGGSARRVPYSELAAGWPNAEWWLAINPGLPIEGYLPAWFVAQLSRGDVRLPGRTLGARARVEAAAAAQARGAAPMSTLAAPVSRSGVNRPAPPQAGAHHAPDTAPPRETSGRARVPAHAAPEPENEPRRLTAIPPRPNTGSRSSSGAPRAPVPPPVPPAPARPPAGGGTLPRRPVDPAAPLPVRTPDVPPAAFFATSDPATRPGFATGDPAPSPAQPAARPTVIEGKVLDTPLPDRWSALREPLQPEPTPPVTPPPPPLTPPAPPPTLIPPAPPVERRAAPESRGEEPTVPRRLGPDPLSDRYGAHSERRASTPESRLAPDPLPTVPMSPPVSPPLSPPRPEPPAARTEPLAHRISELPRRQPTAARPEPAAPPRAEPPPPPPRAEPPPPPPRVEPPPPPEPPPARTEVLPVEPPRPEPAPSRPEPVPSRPEPEPAPTAGRAPDPNFAAANEVEAELLAAAGDGQTDHFLSTLLLAKVLIPIPPSAPRSAQPGDAAFLWRREQVEGQPYVVVFTSQQRMAEYLGPDTDVVEVKFVQLIRAWPDESWSFAVNPGTPVGATLPGAQIKALAAWAVEVGLTDQPAVEEYHEPAGPAVGTASVPANRPVLMQKSIAPAQVAYYLERGYDRVSGFVQRTKEVEHLSTPEQLREALGLGYPGSPFTAAEDEIYLLRWTAYRPDLYRIPFGGRDENGMRAMQGWVIERAPFRGNGFAPGESGEVIAEFKVDSVRLPHGAQMWRMRRDSGETLVAMLDADGPRWRPVGPDGE